MAEFKDSKKLDLWLSYWATKFAHLGVSLFWQLRCAIIDFLNDMRYFEWSVFFYCMHPNTSKLVYPWTCYLATSCFINIFIWWYTRAMKTHGNEVNAFNSLFKELIAYWPKKKKIGIIYRLKIGAMNLFHLLS